MYTFRKLTADDRADFRALRQLALHTDPDEFMITAEEEAAVPRLYIEDAIDQPTAVNFFLGAYHEDRLIAIAGLITMTLAKVRHFGKLTSVYIHPDHRRRGLARRMVEQVLRDAKVAGLLSVRLEVVADNRGAVELYESLGFVTYGCEPAAHLLEGLRWDVLFMNRDI